MDFKKLRSRGRITPTDFHRLTGVSRVTCSQWFSDRKQPHPLHRDRIEKIVTALCKAIDVGELPISGKLPPAERAIRIKEIAKRFI